MVTVHDGNEAVNAVMNANKRIFAVTQTDYGMHDVIERVVLNIFSHCP